MLIPYLLTPVFEEACRGTTGDIVYYFCHEEEVRTKEEMKRRPRSCTFAFAQLILPSSTGANVGPKIPRRLTHHLRGIH